MRRFRDAADAWRVAADAYEEASDLPNAAWAAQQAKGADFRAIDLGRVRYWLSITFERFDPDEPENVEHGEDLRTSATLDEVVSEIKRRGPFEDVQTSRELVRLYESDPDVNYRTGVETRHTLHVRGSESAIRRLVDVLERRGLT